jgi:hypothetical protein
VRNSSKISNWLGFPPSSVQASEPAYTALRAVLPNLPYFELGILEKPGGQNSQIRVKHLL